MAETLHYRALALQVACDAVNADAEPGAARARMAASLERLAGQVRSSKMFIGQDVKLVVLPEYFLSGYPMGESIDAWAAKAALEPGGPEYERLSRMAQDNGVFLAGNVYELDTHFPGLYFQTCFVLAPNGDQVLRYRRLNSMFAPTPHDVWEKFLDIYGLDGVFPVARTEIGNLAAIASEEILYPEIARCHALRGAEVFVHPTSEVGSPGQTPKDVAKRARALENMAYVVSANSAEVRGTPLPSASTDGMSKLVDYLGNVMVEAGYGETMVANAEIDLAALRRHRRRPGMANYLSRQRLELFAQTYAGTSVYPADSLADKVPTRAHFVETQRAVIEKLSESGVI
ncbi:MAG TPA: nitrilase-related carbon-nitrogen hydrolase [Azospirillaceae bacterium]|nr:nitrilase-related carbon-nitrogen hydrolase [Azospirillaceae bacterium]